MLRRAGLVLVGAVGLGSCLFKGPAPADLAEDAALAAAIAQTEARGTAACSHFVGCLPDAGAEEEEACQWGNQTFLRWPASEEAPLDERQACVAAVDAWFACVGEAACPEIRTATRTNANICPERFQAMQAACPSAHGVNAPARRAVLRAP